MHPEHELDTPLPWMSSSDGPVKVLVETMNRCAGFGAQGLGCRVLVSRVFFDLH